VAAVPKNSYTPLQFDWNEKKKNYGKKWKEAIPTLKGLELVRGNPILAQKFKAQGAPTKNHSNGGVATIDFSGEPNANQ